MKRFYQVILSGILCTAFFCSCNSIFSGSTGGIVVDAESSSFPKQGIANVEVYAYTSESDWNRDFDSWTEGTVFLPKSDYYARATSGSDGSFSISKLVWETNPFKSRFGKDADVTKVYLLFYHENFGLNKGETLIVSDSSSNTVYAQLTAIRKSTELNLNFIDVSLGGNISDNFYVKVTVPQSTEKNPDAAQKKYDAVIAGTGQIKVYYPRWASEEDKKNGKENQPEILIEYEQSGENVVWKPCYDADNEEKNYAFRNLADDPVKPIIKNPSFSINLYGKKRILNVPTVGGQYGASNDSANDGVMISMKCAGKTFSADSPDFYIDCGEVSTVSQVLGTSSSEKHGVFSGLGTGFTWTDDEYTNKFAETKLQLYAADANGEKRPVKTIDVRSDTASYNVAIE